MEPQADLYEVVSVTFLPPSGFSVPPAAGGEATTPRSKATRAKLRTCTDVHREIAKLYRECRAGKLDAVTGSRLANMLALVGRLISDSDLEARIDALEQANAGR